MKRVAVFATLCMVLSVFPIMYGISGNVFTQEGLDFEHLKRDECTDTRFFVPLQDVGDACLQSNGLWQVPVDKDFTAVSHGMDLFNEEYDTAAYAAGPSDSPKARKNGSKHYFGKKGFLLRGGIRRPRCATKPQHKRVHFIYALGKSHPNKYKVIRRRFLRAIADANALINFEASRGKRHFDIRVACANRKKRIARISVVRFSHNSRNYNDIVRSVRANGYRRQNTRYVIWYKHGGGNGGLASIDKYTDSSPGYALVYLKNLSKENIEKSSLILLHELTHVLGAVSTASPNSTNGYHCNDGRDVMCYPDGSRDSHYRSDVCKGTTRHSQYDCSRDDYFSLNPKRGSFLHKNPWSNLAHQKNRFFLGKRTPVTKKDFPSNGPF